MKIIEDGESQVTLSVQDGVQVHAWRGSPTLTLVERYYEELEQIVGAGQSLVLLTDTTEAGVPGAHVRKRIGELQKGIEPRLRPLAVGNVVVVRNALIRGALTALKWLVPALDEVVYAGTLEEGLRTARDMREQGQA